MDIMPQNNMVPVFLRSLIFLVLISFTQGARNIKFINNCKIPIWVSPRSNPDSKTVIPTSNIRRLNSGGGQTTYTIQDPGWAGRFWPKAKCDNKGQNCGVGQSEPPCPRQGCSPPAETLVEFYFGKKGDPSGAGENFYDVSLVDGYSYPVKIVPQRMGSFASCTETQCALDASSCPTKENEGIGNLRLSTGQCLAPCKKVTYPKPTGLAESINSSRGRAYCCPTPPVTVNECRKGNVVRSKYVGLVRNKCKTAYSYAYDDTNGLHKCANNVGFTVTYCY